MNVEIGAEAALFPEKEYLSEIFVAVHSVKDSSLQFSDEKVIFLMVYIWIKMLEWKVIFSRQAENCLHMQYVRF